jgi:hypothetical protein
MIRSLDLGDRAGIVVAVACALHCVTAPMLGTSLQLAGVLASERTDFVFLGFSLLISGATVLANCLRRRTRALVWCAFAAGASLLLAARIESAWAEVLETPLVVGGAGMIVAAHVVNLIHCRCRKDGPTCMETGL